MKTRIIRLVYVVTIVSLLTVTSAVFLTSERGVKAEKPGGLGKSASQPRKLEGTWRVQITIRDCQTGAAIRSPFPALVTFARGGTLTSADGGLSPALRSPGHGVWRNTGGHTYNAVTEAFLFNPAGALTGTQRITQAIEIGEDTDEFNANVSAEIFDPNGNLLVTSCATSVGTRME